MVQADKIYKNGRYVKYNETENNILIQGITEI